MHPRRPQAASRDTAPYYQGTDLSLEKQVQTGLNLVLKLRNPAQFPALAAIIAANQEQINFALKSLHYVHFARFLPTPDFSALQVITVFDGELKSYIMDFVAVLGPQFNAILDFVANAPRLPVEMYPDDFWNFVVANNNAAVQPWSAYPTATVIDILDARSFR
jgi:hypothetical protein